MAKRKFMSNGPSGRNRSKKTARRAGGKSYPLPVKDTSAPESDFESFDNPLEEAIENERSRLQQAESILVCAHIALENADEEDDDVPYYPDLVDMARKLVRETVHRLDWVYMEPLVQGSRKATSKSTR